MHSPHLHQCTPVYTTESNLEGLKADFLSLIPSPPLPYPTCPCVTNNHGHYRCIVPLLQEANPFIQTCSYKNLVTYTNPMLQQPSSRSRSSSMPHPVLAHFENVYREAKPPHRMQDTQSATMRDPLHRHGAQMLELQGVQAKSESGCT